jgi:hypothetical protein
MRRAPDRRMRRSADPHMCGSEQQQEYAHSLSANPPVEGYQLKDISPPYLAGVATRANVAARSGGQE